MGQGAQLARVWGAVGTVAGEKLTLIPWARVPSWQGAGGQGNTPYYPRYTGPWYPNGYTPRNTPGILAKLAQCTGGIGAVGGVASNIAGRSTMFDNVR